MTTLLRARTATAVVAALTVVTGGLLVASPGEAASTSGTMVVLGDSITRGASNHAAYNNVKGSKWRGWWSFFAADTRLRPVTYAEPGSGYSRPGKRIDGTGACTGSTFEKRLKRQSVAAKVRAAKIVVLEGGVNDYRKINADGTCNSQTLNQTQLKEQLQPRVRATMKRLAAMRKDPSTVYVTVPWGRNNKQWRTTITGVIRSEAARFGFRYIDTSTATLVHKARTYDGTHPNLAGSKAIGAALSKEYKTKIGTVTPVSPPPARPTTSTAPEPAPAP